MSLPIKHRISLSMSKLVKDINTVRAITITGLSRTSLVKMSIMYLSLIIIRGHYTIYDMRYLAREFLSPSL